MRITRATAEAIRYSCIHFHYAKSVPSVMFGYNIYNDNDEWCGTICFGGGANPNIGKEFGCIHGEMLELVRVALNGKQETTSECVAAAIRQLKKDCRVVKALISYADLDQNHAGIIYQATNWLYLGKMNENARGAFIINGKKVHPKSLYTYTRGVGSESIEWVREHLDPNAREFITAGKHKYLYCYDKKMRKQWMQRALPYPKKGEPDEITARTGE